MNNTDEPYGVELPDDPTAQHERQEVKLQTDEVNELEGVNK